MLERCYSDNLQVLYSAKIALLMPQGAVRILVVDDEPALLDSMRSYLSRLGHKVTAFRNAATAWESLASEDSAPSVVIVDLTLEGMSGEEFIRKVMECNPAIAVLATSGYPTSLETLGLPQGAGVAMLQKPFTPRMLTEALERLLGGEHGVTGSRL
jgi:DNA-binding NtrC family response regulator